MHLGSARIPARSYIVNNNIDCDRYDLRIMATLILMMMMKMRRPHITIKELYTHITRVTAEGQ